LFRLKKNKEGAEIFNLKWSVARNGAVRKDKYCSPATDHRPLFMKIFIFFVILVSGLGTVNAQETNPEPEKSPKAGSFRKPLEEAQKSKEASTSQINLTYDDGCGNPLAETRAYSFRNGKVIVITDDNKLVVKVVRSSNVKSEKYEKPDDAKRLQQPQLFTVSLVGIDESVNQSEVKRFLLDYVLDRDVTVIGNTRKDDDKSIDALVKLTGGDLTGEISQLLLEKGIAKFKEFQLTNLVPMRTACELKRAENKAKTERTGIWAK
jgi:hypothetical protein